MNDEQSTTDAANVPRWRTAIAPVLRVPTPVIFAVAVAVALLLLWRQGALGNLWTTMQDADWLLLVVAAPVYLIGVLLLCYRWHILVVMAQGHSNLPRASEAFLTSVVINYAAPIGLAVPSRALLTKRALGLDARATGTIAIWEIIVDVLVLGVGSLLWLAIARGSTAAIGSELAGSTQVWIAAGAMVSLFTIAAAAWFTRSPSLRSRVAESTKRVILAPRDRPKDAGLALAVTAIYWILQGAVLAILLAAFGIDPSFELVLGITSIPILVGMLSPVPGGAVVREALMYVVARLAGVAGAPVVAAALVYRLALFAAIPILYAIVRWWIGRSDGATVDSPLSDPR